MQNFEQCSDLKWTLKLFFISLTKISKRASLSFNIKLEIKTYQPGKLSNGRVPPVDDPLLDEGKPAAVVVRQLGPAWVVIFYIFRVRIMKESFR